jgi:hypothetical protein
VDETKLPDGNDSGGGNDGGGTKGTNGGGDDNGCEEDRREAEKACKEAMAGLRGTNLAPYGKLPRKKWDFDTCLKSQMREDCGGTPVQWKPIKASKAKKKK